MDKATTVVNIQANIVIKGEKHWADYFRDTLENDISSLEDSFVQWLRDDIRPNPQDYDDADSYNDLDIQSTLFTSDKRIVAYQGGRATFFIGIALIVLLGTFFIVSGLYTTSTRGLLGLIMIAIGCLFFAWAIYTYSASRRPIK